MQIIDNQGRLFGKINIIDFFVCLLIIGICLGIYKGVKIFQRTEQITKEKNTNLKDQYKKTFTCSNCGNEIEVWVETGKPIPENHEMICPICKNRVIVNKKIKEIKPQKEIDWQQEYYKYLLKEMRELDKSN